MTKVTKYYSIPALQKTRRVIPVPQNSIKPIQFQKCLNIFLLSKQHLYRFYMRVSISQWVCESINHSDTFPNLYACYLSVCLSVSVHNLFWRILSPPQHCTPLIKGYHFNFSLVNTILAPLPFVLRLRAWNSIKPLLHCSFKHVHPFIKQE